MLGGKSGSRRVRALLLTCCSSVLLAIAVAIAALPAAAAAARTAAKRGAATRPHLVTGTPVALDVPENGDDPLVAYDPVSQVTFIAWSDAQAPDNGVELCVLPGGATACSGGGPVLLSVSSTQNPAITGDNTIGLGGLTVLPNGNVVVLGTPVSNSTVAWESPGDGSAFLSASQGLQNGGSFISPVSLFYTFNNAVALNNTDVALLDDYGDYFSDSPYAGPESPDPISSSNSNQGNGGLYPRKSLETSGPEIGAIPAPAPAPTGTELVVGVGDNYAGPNTTLPGCVNSAGTGYGVDVGTVNGGSKAAGTLNHSGIPGYGLLACSALAPVVASGGGAGLGVIEEEGSGISGAGTTYTVDWRPFNATATGGSFGSPVQLQDITAVSLNGGEDFDVAEDGQKGVYASWKDEKGLVLDYSPNGGVTWDGPDVINGVGSEDESQGDPTITAIGNGVGEIAYHNNLGEGDQVYVEQVSFIPPQPTTLTTSQVSGSVTGANLTVPDNTVGETDTAALAGTNAATATGSVTYSLYSDNTCSSSDLVTSSTETVAGGAVPPSSPVTNKLKAGDTYYWEASYSGDQFNAVSTSTCGSEKLTAAPVSAPSSTTTSGTTVTLTLSCPGPCTVTVTIDLPSGGGARAGETPKLVKLTSGKFSLKRRKGGKEHLHLRWSRYARKLLKHDHDKLTTLLQMSVKAGKGRFHTASSLKLRK